ncbi:hypothetical protein P692DRAFT_20823525 [Suillus brevipes Sb2]|nr:hypothetical protein P692DRAFT_20823525 [Suillus brevipes Sb2]
MVRTKQTAKKSHGGIAPRVDLRGGARVAQGTEEMEVCPKFQHNEYCIVCRDGSIEEHQLFLCDGCPRVMCSMCMVIPPALAMMLEHDDVKFRCICCHVDMQQQGNRTYSPYMGFYRNSKPISTDFLRINATLEVSLKSELSSAPVLFVHLTLVNNDAGVGTFELGYQFLRPYFPHGGISFQEIQFDLGTGTKIESYESMVGDLVRGLTAKRHWTRIVFGISNHTDNTNGDPFIGYPARKKTYIAARIDNFLDVVLMPWQPLITRALESYLWMFSCGSLVNNAESFSYLQSSVLRHRISASVCFNAVRFQPATASHLLLAFIELVLVERLPIRTAFPDMLGQSYKLGRHSDVFLILRKDDISLDITKFVWTHSSLRPWGQYLPVQCPQCGWTNAWASVHQNKLYAFECKNDQCKKRKGAWYLLDINPLGDNPSCV